MAPSESNRPDGSGRSDALRVLRPVVAVLAAVAIAFCGWSAWEYSQGADPLAFLGGALQTVEEEGSAPSIELAPQGDDAAQPADAAENSGEASSEAPADGSAEKDALSAEAPSGSSSSAQTTAGGSGPSSSANAPTGSGSSGGKPSSAPSAPSGGSGSGGGSGATSPSRPARITVTITVDGSQVGAGSSSATLSLAPGSTVYDALAASGVSYNAKSTGYGMYVSSIAGLAEKDHGAMSGWLYSVNGVEPNYACSSYELSDGDSIRWWYANVEY